MLNKKAPEQDYLFFSSTELMEYFHNNVRSKDLKTQMKRIMEMARTFMAKKDFVLTDLYSLLILIRDRQTAVIVEEVISLYFKQEERPIGVIIEIEELEETADLEIEFSAFSKEKTHFNVEDNSFCGLSFSHGVAMEQFIHCSGVKPDNNTIDIEQQTKQCLLHLKTILQTNGSDLSKVYAFIVYLRKKEMLKAVEKTFATMNLDGGESANEVVIVSGLSGDWLLEISCSAFR